MANPILDADILPLLGILLASGVLAGTLAGLFGVGGGSRIGSRFIICLRFFEL